VPLGFLGLPSLHSIIEGIANGFFGALASALVPGFLKHGTVATIQHLVALPDPGTWAHVGQLQGDMTYLAAMLMPVTLAVGTFRYWLMGFTGQGHPVAAVARCTGVTGVLVAYPWIVGQTVAATNTLTHAILGFPTVGNGLQRIIGVLFGGALLAGAGGVFGAFLVIIGVLFAAGLFAAQVMLTVALALLVVAGPPLIALSAIPELSHLARAWAHALLATALVPLGWTVLFATAGALCLDATSFTGGAGGLPGHVAAAFAGLITFVLAVKLPWMLFGEIRRLLTSTSLTGQVAKPSAPSRAPGAERVRAAHARLRTAAFEGIPSLGGSVGRAAGAMGAPAGGPIAAAQRGLAGAARRAGVIPVAAGVAVAGVAAGRDTKTHRQSTGLRGRLASAGVILRDAPRDAKGAMAASARNTKRGSVPVPAAETSGAPPAGERANRRAAGRLADRSSRASSGAGPQQKGEQLSKPTRAASRRRASQAPSRAQAPEPAHPSRSKAASRTANPAPRPHPPGPAPRSTRPPQPPAPRAEAPEPAHPGRKVRTAATPDRPESVQTVVKPSEARGTTGAPLPARPQPSQPPKGRAPVSRKPRPGREP
jgi:uncharacterized membrane protein